MGRLPGPELIIPKTLRNNVTTLPSYVLRMNMSLSINEFQLQYLINNNEDV